jgi:hypothetical protein
LAEARSKPFGKCLDEHVTIAEAKSSGWIPADFHEYIEDICECGSERITVPSLKHIRCVDSRCYIRTGLQLSKMFERFGCVGMGPNSCLTLAKHFRDGTYYDNIGRKVLRAVDLLKIGDDDWCLGSAKRIEYNTAVGKICNCSITLARMISNMAIPGLDDKAEQLFGLFASTYDLFSAVVGEGTLQFFANRGVRDVEVVYNFIEFGSDIQSLAEMRKHMFISVSRYKLPVCITGSVVVEYPYGLQRMTKAEYVDLCNTYTYNAEGVKIFDIVLNKAIQTTGILVCTDGYNSSSLRIARSREMSKVNQRIVREHGNGYIPTDEDLILRSDERIVYSPTEFLVWLNNARMGVGV